MSPSLFLSNHIFSPFSFFLCPTSYRYLALTLNISLSLCISLLLSPYFLFSFHRSFFLSIYHSRFFLYLYLSLSRFYFISPHSTYFLLLYFSSTLAFSSPFSFSLYLYLFLFLFRSYHFPLYLSPFIRLPLLLSFSSFFSFLLLALSVYVFISPILLPCFSPYLYLFLSIFIFFISFSIPPTYALTLLWRRPRGVGVVLQLVPR